tara:strand:- start:856 stop:1029 length:174 start_codon:yes stop_codon:yes gene_type:complete
MVIIYDQGYAFVKEWLKKGATICGFPSAGGKGNQYPTDSRMFPEKKSTRQEVSDDVE